MSGTDRRGVVGGGSRIGGCGDVVVGTGGVPVR